MSRFIGYETTKAEINYEAWAQSKMPYRRPGEAMETACATARKSRSGRTLRSALRAKTSGQFAAVHRLWAHRR